MRNCCDIFLLFLLYIIYHISFHFHFKFAAVSRVNKTIFFSSYLFLPEIKAYKVANFVWRHIVEDYWGNVFDPSEVSITVTSLNHRLHHVVVFDMRVNFITCSYS